MSESPAERMLRKIQSGEPLWPPGGPQSAEPMDRLKMDRLKKGDLTRRRQEQIDLATQTFTGYEIRRHVRVVSDWSERDEVRCFWAYRDNDGVGWACRQRTRFVVLAQKNDTTVLVPACMAHVGHALTTADKMEQAPDEVPPG